MSRRFWSYVIATPLVLSAWAVIFVATTLARPPGTPVAVLALGGSRVAIEAVAAAGGSILEVRGDAVVAISEEPGFVGRLYSHGPLIAFAARKGGGCGFGNARNRQARSG